MTSEPTGIARRESDRILLPGLATAHSHAFQRVIRGRTQRRGGAAGSFWSWREAMYGVAQRLDPETIFAVSRFAYAELALAGVTAVGEFHYVHHQPDGTPYDDRLALADAVVRAAREVGLRIVLLRVIYERGGAGRALEPAQRRFADASLDDALADVEALAARFASDPCVGVGLAPHSVRAVTRDSIRRCAEAARGKGWPLHMHVAEQPREIDENVAEHGVRPLQMLIDDGVVDERFVAVHATHLDDAEIRALGAARAFACICRTTERDLGDGLPRIAPMLASGVRLCTGVDSHAISDPFEEARAIELDERSRTLSRQAAADAPTLLAAGTTEGYAALGIAGGAEDRVVLDATDPALAGVHPPDDALVWSATPRAIRDVTVAGRPLVVGGELPAFDAIAASYHRALRRLALAQ